MLTKVYQVCIRLKTDTKKVKFYKPLCKFILIQAGYIRVPDVDEYMIEPLKDSKPTSDKEHPHIIYKRSDIKDKSGGSNCLTKGKT